MYAIFYLAIWKGPGDFISSTIQIWYNFLFDSKSQQLAVQSVTNRLWHEGDHTGLVCNKLNHTSIYVEKNIF